MYYLVLNITWSSSEESCVKTGMRSKLEGRGAASSESGFGKTPTLAVKGLRFQLLAWRKGGKLGKENTAGQREFLKEGLKVALKVPQTANL